MKRLYAVRDVKADTFAEPFCADTDGLAIRLFSDAVRSDKPTLISQHPEDFGLYYLGQYYQDTGLISPVDQPLHLASAQEFANA